MDNSAQTPAAPPVPKAPSAVELLSKFLEDNNIELRLTPLAQVIEGGGVVIQPQQIVAQFKAEPSSIN